jgi:hypothetical protein
MQRESAPPTIRELYRSLEAVMNEKESAISAQQYRLAAECRDQESKLRSRLENLETGWQAQQSSEKLIVTPEDLAQVVSMWSGIPVESLDQDDAHAEVQDIQAAVANLTQASGEGVIATVGLAKPLEIFYSYAHEDEGLLKGLTAHLRLLKRQGKITDWHDRRIGAGNEWKNEIDRRLDSARIILLLVSSSFLASDYCYDAELKRAMELHDMGSARVIPVILRPCDWDQAPFGRLQALPQDGKPVTMWRDRDAAFRDVARGIRAVSEELAAQP